MKYILLIIIFLTSAICSYGQEYTKDKRVTERNLNNDKLIHLQYEAWENDSTPTQVTVIQKEVEPSIFRRILNDVPPPPPAIDYTSTKLYYLNGYKAWRENIVLLMDGYSITDSALARANATTIYNGFINAEFWKEYYNNYNWVAVISPSPTSGVNTVYPPYTNSCVNQGYPLITDKNPLYGSTFNYGGLCRLLYATNTATIQSVLTNYFPQGVKQTMIIANTPYYGGSGGTYATGSMNSQSLLIMLHEIGHSYAKLADEYEGYATFRNPPPSGGYYYRAWANGDNAKPNIDTARTFNRSKYKLYMNPSLSFKWWPNSSGGSGANDLTAFEGAAYYSPAAANNFNYGVNNGANPTTLRFNGNSLMQSLSINVNGVTKQCPLYAINYEAHLYSFYSTLPTTKWLASSTSTTDTIKYPNYPTVVKQLTSTKLKEEWKVNGVVISNPATYTYPFGNSTITYTLKDTSWQTKNLQGNSPYVYNYYTLPTLTRTWNYKRPNIVVPPVIDSCKIDSFSVSSTVAKKINISFVPCKKSGVTYQVQVMKFTLAGVQQTGWTNKSVTYTTNTASKRIGSLSVSDSNKRYDVRIVATGKCVLTSNVLSVITK